MQTGGWLCGAGSWEAALAALMAASEAVSTAVVGAFQHALLLGLSAC